MQRLDEDIKNRAFHRFYLLYGEEDYLKKIYRNRLKKAVLYNSDDINYSYFEGKDIDTGNIKETVETLPFFSNYRLAVIEDSGFFKSANILSDYLKDMPQTSVVVFVEKEIDKRNKLYKFVNKNGLVVEMGQMDIKDLRNFIALTLKRNNKQMKMATADYFLQQAGSSLYNLTNEMDKLVLYTYEKEEITMEDIDAVCCIQVTGHIFQMIDHAVTGNVNKALKLYKDLLELRESPMSILYLVTRQFNLLLQAKAAGSITKSELAARMKVKLFAAGKYLDQAAMFKESQLKVILDECIETEYKFKRGLIDAQTGMEIILLKVARQKF